MTTALHRILLIVAFSGMFTALSAQNFRTTFRGTVADENDLPLPGVTIMVLNPADSVLVQFTSSDEKGAFEMKGVPPGEYLLNFSFLGTQPLYKHVTSGYATDTDLGAIKLTSSTTVLTEVEVKADFIPVEVKKDTISYNADAFQTNPDAAVEDLLKKLPGIEVGTDGSIKAQGEDVKKVLVDGKEFFGDDPKMATKNLPAKAVKKVKVYDKKSDIAEFTGIDDGEREKTIDLQLREEFKKGLFGKGQVGYGTDEKYSAKASINRFSETLQLSFLGQYNNINEQGFSFTDQMAFSGNSTGGRGGFRSSGIPDYEGVGNGLINTGAGGVNFNWQKAKMFNIRTSYFYNNVDNTLLQQTIRENLSQIPYDTEEDLDRSDRNVSHRVSLNSQFRPDTLYEISLNGRINAGDGRTVSENFLQNYIPGESIESEALTNTNRTNDNFSANGDLSFIRRFDDKGQNISVTLGMNKNENINESRLDALTTYFTTGSTEELDQLQYAASDNFNWNVQSSFTQPLLKRRFLEFSYMYNQNESDYDKDVDDIVDEDPIPNEALSNAYSSIFKIHRPALTFRYSGETKNANVSLQYQFSELTGFDKEANGEIVKSYKHFLPRVIWRNDLGNGKHIRFYYNTRINPPSITQLSPVVDNSDPLRLSTGNPDLEPEYNHYGSLNFHSFTQFSSTSFFVSLNGSLTDNKIITSKSIDEQFREISQPINIEQEKTAGLYTSFGRPFKPLHSRFNINLNASYTRTQNYINSSLLDVNRWSRTAGIAFTNMNSNVLEYNLGGQWTFTDSYYKLNDTLNQNTLLHNYFADVTLTIWKKWKLNVIYNYSLYTSKSFPDQALPLMKASISRYILPKDRGQIVLSVFDALDENRGLSRSSQVNYIEEVRSNSIGRYFMLAFVYNIRGAGQEASTGVRMMGPRR